MLLCLQHGTSFLIFFNPESRAEHPAPRESKCICPMSDGLLSAPQAGATLLGSVSPTSLPTDNYSANGKALLTQPASSPRPCGFVGMVCCAGSVRSSTCLPLGRRVGVGCDRKGLCPRHSRTPAGVDMRITAIATRPLRLVSYRNFPNSSFGSFPNRSANRWPALQGSQSKCDLTCFCRGGCHLDAVSDVWFVLL